MRTTATIARHLLLAALNVGCTDEVAELNKRVEDLYRDGKYAEAIPLAQRASELEEQALGPDHPHVAVTLISLTELYQATGPFAQPEPLLQRRCDREKSPEARASAHGDNTQQRWDVITQMFTSPQM